MTATRRPLTFDEATHRPYLTIHSTVLTSARHLASAMDEQGIRSFDEWVQHFGISCLDGPLGPSCLGLSLQVQGSRGIALSTAIPDTQTRNLIGWHELGHLLTNTARASGCRPDEWLSVRVERLAWFAGSVYAVSAFEAVQVGWNVEDPHAIAVARDIPIELVELRVALAVRDREIPLLRLHGTPLVERALRALVLRCQDLARASTDCWE